MLQSSNPQTKKKLDRFLKGPVPWDWICLASSVSSTAGLVGFAIWRLVGATNSRTVRLSNRELELLNISARSKTRALEALKKLGLIEVEQKAGCLPVVTVLDCPDQVPHWWELGA